MGHVVSEWFPGTLCIVIVSSVQGRAHDLRRVYHLTSDPSSRFRWLASPSLLSDSLNLFWIRLLSRGLHL